MVNLFVNKINNLQIRIKDGYTHPLSNIDENNIMQPFSDNSGTAYIVKIFKDGL